MGSHACSPIKELCILEVAVSFLVQIAAPLAAALKQNSLYIEFVHQLFAQVLYCACASRLSGWFGMDL